MKYDQVFKILKLNYKLRRSFYYQINIFTKYELSEKHLGSKKFVYLENSKRLLVIYDSSLYIQIKLQYLT